MFENLPSSRFDGEGQAQAIIQWMKVQGVRILDALEIAQGMSPFANLCGVEVVEFIAEVAAHGVDVVFFTPALSS